MNCPVDVSKIVSMIIQDLRQFNYGALIDIVKKAEYSLDFVDHDNWDGGIDYFKLRFHLKYADFAKILSAQKNYEEILTKSLNSFYKDERFVITGIELVAKIDQYVDWAAVAPQHNKESVLRLIEEEKGTLIKAGTGIIQIRDKKTFLYRGFNSTWFYLMQIILILRSIRTFAIKNLSGTDYQGLYLRGMIEWLKKYYSMVYDKPEKPRRIKGFEVFSLVFSSFSKPKNHTEISRIIGGVSLTTNE